MFEMWKSFTLLCFSVFLTKPGHKNAHNLAALYFTIFLKLCCISYMILHWIVYFYYIIFKIADCILAIVEVFLKNWHFAFIGPYRPTLIQQDKSFFIMIPKHCIKYVYRLGSSQHSLQTMHPFKECVILLYYAGVRVRLNLACVSNLHVLHFYFDIQGVNIAFVIMYI